MTTLGTEPTGMRGIENLIKNTPSPSCGSRDPQGHNELADCVDDSRVGGYGEAAMPRALEAKDEYSLDRHRLYLVPDKQVISWFTKIRRFARSLREDPNEALRIALQHDRPTQWRIGTIEDTPAMQIVADFYLTNTTQEDLFILKTYFVPYTCNGWVPSGLPAEGHAFVKNHKVEGGGTENYKIPSGSTYQGHAAWWMHPPIMSEGETLTGRGCFVDQFDNEYWTPLIKWKYREKRD
jgi:hypothetical protein